MVNPAIFKSDFATNSIENDLSLRNKTNLTFLDKAKIANSHH